MNRFILLAVAVLMISPVSATSVKSKPASAVPSAAQECRVQTEAKEYEKAAKPCTQAANLGDLEAQHILGRMYEKGTGVSRDLEAAFKWYSRAAEKGHAASQRRVAAAYYWGLGGVSKDDVKAFEWFKRAAEGGDKRAQKQMAEAYRRGLGGLPKDEKLAREWAERAERN
ncbi:MAG TPA: tetratricopeptide repeat protein [Burkholderiales bacterium]|nr:tetratricopeptide repeat protein [Burkholderiales bacterium]